MQAFLYFLIAICATTAGGMTGIGGGIVIKPVLDAIGQYDVATIGVLSSITVFSMALVSVGRQLQQQVRVSPKIVLPLALGSVAGGNLGQLLFEALTARLQAGAAIVVIQNVVLALVVVGIFLYMLHKSKWVTRTLEGVAPALLSGLAMGVLSSFLGIGGGPMNVALLIFLFSMDTKRAAFCSIITILCSQAAKLIMLLAAGNFHRYDLSMLPFMVAGAVAGGFIGSALSKKLSVGAVERAFNSMQGVVFLICIFNIVSNLGG